MKYHAQIRQSRSYLMLDNQKGCIVFECDNCGNVLETGARNFEAARNCLRRQGWHPYKEGNEWKHSCDDCERKADVR